MKSVHLPGLSPPRLACADERMNIACATPAVLLHRPDEHRAAFLVYTILIAAARACAVPSGIFQIGLKR
jgi:hypothetical protein